MRPERSAEYSGRMDTSEFHNAAIDLMRTRRTYGEAVQRLADSRPERYPEKRLNAWPFLNPWAVMTAIFLGWELAHIIGAL